MRLFSFKKLNILNNRAGFSITELMLALALLLIAITLGYNLLFFARTSFERSEERWMEQNEVVSVTNVIYDALNESYYVAIIDDISNVPSDLDFYGAFYVNGNGETIYEHSDGSTITTAEIPGDFLTLTFAKETYTINEITYEYNDLINMTVVSNELAYKIDTQVHLDNMNRDRNIHGDTTGSVIVFQTKDIVETVPDDLYDSLCFVATAAYGSPMEPELGILRSFRDDFLMHSDLGAKFVKFYYKNSPAAAAAIAENPLLRLMTRSFLYPVIVIVSLVMKPILFTVLLAAAYVTVVLNRRRKKALI